MRVTAGANGLPVVLELGAVRRREQQGGAFNVYHSYDANNNGNSYLRISELVWDQDGWPVSGGP